MCSVLYHGLMKNCAFLTLDEKGDYVIDDEHAIQPLADLGWRVNTLSWRQKGIPWKDFDAVVIRSTWDYWDDSSEFLETLATIDSQARLANPLPLVRWNLAKTYLQDLEDNGVDIVPTLWLGEPETTRIQSCFEHLGLDELVIKPVIGANGQDAYRISRTDEPGRLERIVERFKGKDGMVQPFMPHILTEGEYSLFYFSGELSHAILKKPADSEFRSQEEHGAEIVAVRPEDLLVQRGRRAIDSVTPGPLYARVDFIRDEKDDFRVIEMELIEPSMYLRMDAAAPARFAQAIDTWFSDD